MFSRKTIANDRASTDQHPVSSRQTDHPWSASTTTNVWAAFTPAQRYVMLPVLLVE